MKKIVVFIILIVFQYNSYSQQTFIYKPTVTIDYESNQTSDVNIDDIKNMIKIAETQMEAFEFKLVVDNDVSVFYKDKTLVDESKNTRIIKIAEALAFANQEWFYDARSSYLHLNTDFMKKPFSVKFNELPKWEIKNEKKKIGNYQVTKAITKRKFISFKGVDEIEIEAWFCPDIPIAHGPLGAVGLPGLVIQLKHQKTIFTLHDIVDKATKVAKPKTDDTMSSQEFYTLIDQKVGDFKSMSKN